MWSPINQLQGNSPKFEKQELIFKVTFSLPLSSSVLQFPTGGACASVRESGKARLVSLCAIFRASSPSRGSSRGPLTRDFSLEKPQAKQNKYNVHLYITIFYQLPEISLSVSHLSKTGPSWTSQFSIEIFL